MRSVGIEPLFKPGVSLEASFNKITTLRIRRPYNTQIFSAVRTGNINFMIRLLSRKEASIYDVDLYDLGLLYVGIPSYLDGEWLVPLLTTIFSMRLITVSKAAVETSHWNCVHFSSVWVRTQVG